MIAAKAWMATVGAVLFASVALGQTPPTSSEEGFLLDPATQNALIGAITLLTPIVISFLRRMAVEFIPKTPNVILPFLAPLLGPTLNVLMEALFGVSVDVTEAVVAGTAGVGVREGIDQSVKFFSRSVKTPTVGTSAAEAKIKGEATV